MRYMKIAHLIAQLAENLIVMVLTDALGNHVPQVSQHGHEWKRLIVCTEKALFISVIMYQYQYQRRRRILINERKWMLSL